MVIAYPEPVDATLYKAQEDVGWKYTVLLSTGDIIECEGMRKTRALGWLHLVNPVLMTGQMPIHGERGVDVAIKHIVLIKDHES